MTYFTSPAHPDAGPDRDDDPTRLPGLGWRRIQPGSGDGVTNMLAMLTQAVAKNLTVTVVVDGTALYQTYL